MIHLQLSQFLTYTLHTVMDKDATLASHPIVQRVSTPSEISSVFDMISYSKGASIIRMLEHLVGPDVFRQATSNYLNKFAFQNAETSDYLNELHVMVKSFDVK